MSKARRAAPDAPEVTTVDAAPRRGRTSAVGSVVRRALAPTAIVGVMMATTALTFVPMGPTETTSVADPLAAHDARVANRASREFARVPVPTPYVSATPTASPSPSASPSPTATVSETPAAAAAAAPAAEASPTVAPTPTVEAAPEVDWSIEGTDVGTRWSTASVNIRSGPGTRFDVVDSRAVGGKVTVTDKSHEGWQQVSLGGTAGWIKAGFLTDQEPPAPAPAATAPSTSSASTATSTASSSAAGGCAQAGSATSGMTSRTIGVLNQVCANFPGISSYGGYRAGDSGYHGSGQAIDAMISGDAGWAVARWVQANASSLGVVEVIYSQQIWTAQRSGDGWRSMSDRGSATANHFDHVHISVG